MSPQAREAEHSSENLDGTKDDLVSGTQTRARGDKTHCKPCEDLSDCGQYEERQLFRDSWSPNSTSDIMIHAPFHVNSGIIV